MKTPERIQDDLLDILGRYPQGRTAWSSAALLQELNFYVDGVQRAALLHGAGENEALADNQVITDGPSVAEQLAASREIAAKNKERTMRTPHGFAGGTRCVYCGKFSDDPVHRWAEQ